jgi:hypothetical protein
MFIVSTVTGNRPDDNGVARKRLDTIPASRLTQPGAAPAAPMWSPPAMPGGSGRTRLPGIESPHVSRNAPVVPYTTSSSSQSRDNANLPSNTMYRVWRYVKLYREI